MPVLITEATKTTYAVYSLLDDKDESIALSKNINSFLKIQTENPFDRVDKWNQIPEDLLIQFKDALGIGELKIKPAINDFYDNCMNFIVRKEYNYEGPYQQYKVYPDIGVFSIIEFQDIKINPEKGCIHNGEFVPKRFMKYINF
jgi:hypothetical protein